MIDLATITGPRPAQPTAFEKAPPVLRKDGIRLAGRSILSYVTRPLASVYVEVQTPPLTSELRQGTMWDKRLDFKESIVAKLREAGRADLAKPLTECHTDHFFARCKGCKKAREFWNKCKKVWCPVCQPGIAANRVRELETYLEAFAQPKHVVLTVKNFPILTKARLKEIRRWFAALLESKFAKVGRRDWVACDISTHEPIFRTSCPWLGGMVSEELTKESKGWHLHLHAVVNSRFIDAVHLADEWHKRTGGAGHIVKVLDCRQKNYLKEVAKYAVKGSELAKWKPEEIVEFVLAFSKTRTFWTFGSLYGDRTKFKEAIKDAREKGKACECGCVHWEVFTEQEWEWEKLTKGSYLDIPPPILAPPTTLVFGFDKDARNTPIGGAQWVL